MTNRRKGRVGVPAQHGCKAPRLLHQAPTLPHPVLPVQRRLLADPCYLPHQNTSQKTHVETLRLHANPVTCHAVQQLSMKTHCNAFEKLPFQHCWSLNLKCIHFLSLDLPVLETQLRQNWSPNQVHPCPNFLILDLPARPE